MSQMLARSHSNRPSKTAVGSAIVLLAATLMALATVRAYHNFQAHQARETWLEHALQGYANVRDFCADRQVFGILEETPPLVRFYLNEEGVFENTFADWRIDSDGQRVIYRLEVQFQEFDQETITRLATLDSYIDDGDLFNGQFLLTKSGFACTLPGPLKANEKLTSLAAAKPQISSI
ncbi:hypothetical protein [Cerasicoccus frondis]|uniref:hypothetical protein n=1 Tax=Cerasicoccus frondis TaxID=490090 RepID=UPI002852CFC3|nr:hypothetical protein [Cerasicoccus frondis]